MTTKINLSDHMSHTAALEFITRLHENKDANGIVRLQMPDGTTLVCLLDQKFSHPRSIDQESDNGT